MAARLHSGLRWLRAGTAEVIRLRPASDTSAAAAESRDGTLATALARWSSRVQRWRGLVLARRHLLVALGLAIVLQILSLTAGLSELALLAAPCVLLAGIAVELRHRPAPAQVAGLLDEQIGLYDLIATGFELQARSRGEMRQIEERALERATGEASRSLGAWRARTAPAGAEWSTVALGVATLAVLLLLAPSHVGSRSAVGGAAAHAGSARAGRHGSAQATASAPVAKAPAPASSAAEHAADGATRNGSQSSTQTVAKPRGGAPDKPSAGLKASARTGGDAGKPAGAKAGAGATGQAGSRTGTTTGVSPVSAPHLATAAPNGARTTAGSTPAARSHTSTPTSSAGRRTGSAGRASGTSSAGRARGSTRLGGSHALTGSATKSLPLKAGYAPARQGSRSTNGTEKGSGGGGHGRSRAVEGSAGAGAGGGASFVPSDGGAVAAAGSGSLISYLASLKWVQEQPW